ncbi:hypothetical protein [Herbaspirillum rhizosphaerae]|uniref:hypothetical protein n=1 Tax=Herbaspirillum rhizosphaerae TaxID=346179 RepID=UPI0012ECD2D6|nr:hypothetical protein [Herbaspirillum rhizosphaerae]
MRIILNSLQTSQKSSNAYHPVEKVKVLTEIDFKHAKMTIFTFMRRNRDPSTPMPGVLKPCTSPLPATQAPERAPAATPDMACLAYRLIPAFGYLFSPNPL